MTIEGTPKEVANFILCLLKPEQEIIIPDPPAAVRESIVSDLPAAVRESIKGYFNRGAGGE